MINLKTSFHLPLLLLSILFLATGCATAPEARITQYSTIDALLSGVYDGAANCAQLRENGDTGIGTFEALDGEMIVLDGTVYQVKIDGEVKKVTPDTKTPFAVVVPFAADMELPIEGKSLQDFEGALTKALKNPNLFYAIKVHGLFKSVEVRSVPRQTKPYPPLAEAAKGQRVFKLENISGTLVGFRCPPLAKGINVPGCHLHFLSDDKTKGGHVLNFELAGKSAEVDLMSCRELLLVLPPDASGFGSAELGIDRSKELQKIEK